MYNGESELAGRCDVIGLANMRSKVQVVKYTVWLCTQRCQTQEVDQELLLLINISPISEATRFAFVDPAPVALHINFHGKTLCGLSAVIQLIT